MRKLLLASLFALGLGGSLALLRPSTHQAPVPGCGAAASFAQPAAFEAYGKLPLTFEENRGQADPRAKFVCHGNGCTLLVGPGEARLTMTQGDKSASVRMTLVGARPDAEAASEDRQEGVSNYLIGNDPSKWLTGVPNCGKARFHEVYPGIDVVYYGNQGRLEYDFVVAPGADPNAIALQFDGADSAKVDAAGDLVLATACGEVRQHKPIVYQEVNGAHQEVGGSYVRHEDGRFGFQVASHDAGRPLVIDPVLSYCTSTGISTAPSGIAVDSAGNAYVVGWAQTLGLDMSTSAWQSACKGGMDAFVQKINPSGTELVYSTYLGGSKQDLGRGIAVDASGCAWITGDTLSSDFPVTGAVYMGHFTEGANDVFVARLNPAGNALLVSTLLGARDVNGAQQRSAFGYAIAVDGAGNAYVTGEADGSGNPSDPLYEGFPGSQQYNNIGALGGWGDVFVAKISPAGQMLFDTLVGGTDTDKGTGIQVDGSGNIFVTGQTYIAYGASTWSGFPSPNHRQYGNPREEASFVFELSPSGTNLVYSTVFGVADGLGHACQAWGLALDSHACVYVTGQVDSPLFPTTAGALQVAYGGGLADAFVTKFGPDGSMVYSTYLGGSSQDYAFAIAVDDAGRAYVTGNTWSPGYAADFPFTDNLNPGFPYGAFLTVLDPSGSSVVYSTLLAQALVDKGVGVAVDHSGNAYVAGVGHPRTTQGVFDSFDGWYQEYGFMAKIGPGTTPTIVDPSPGSTLTSSHAMFSYSAAPGVTDYWVWVGRTQGGSDLYNKDGGASYLAACVSNLPTDGSTLYVRLWSLLGGAWHSTDSTFTAANFAGARPAWISPTPGSALTSSGVTIAWSAGSGVTDYQLSLGRAQGASDLFNQDMGASQSAMVSTLPMDGSTVYARLRFLSGGAWQETSTTFIAGNSADVLPMITSPTPGSTLTSSSVTFTWSAGVGITGADYRLQLGTWRGGADLFQSDDGVHGGGWVASLSAAAANLPTDGRGIYARIWGDFRYTDYFFTAANPAMANPGMTTPVPGSTLNSSTETFTWSAGSGVTDYSLSVGSTQAGSDLFSQDMGSNLSATVSNLPTDGSTLYVRLRYLRAGAWLSTDYTYRAATLVVVNPAITDPANGSTLASSAVTFTWSQGSGITRYGLYVGHTQGSGDLFNHDMGTSLSATVSNLPTDGSTVYVRLRFLAGSLWNYTDYTFTAATNSGGGGNVNPAMTSPAPGSILASSSVTFTWSAGSGVASYWLYVGRSAGANNLFDSGNLGTSRSRTVSGLPTDGSAVYVRLWYLAGGAWHYTDATYTAATVANANPAMTSPASGSTLTSSSVTFTWSAGSGVAEYWLYVGRSAGSNSLFDSGNLGASLSATVSNLPTDGSTVYVRLWFLSGGSWHSADATYTAAIVANSDPAITSPAVGSTLTSSSVTFSWSAGSGVAEYWLYVGRSAGSSNLFDSGNLGTSLSALVSGLPTDGCTVYVRLWYLSGGAWRYADSSYR